ncbi:MAG: RDD family protein [Kineosporiaceae bacterium]
MQTDDPAPRPPTTRRPGAPAPGSVVPAPARPVQGRRAGVVTRVLADTVDAAVVAAILVAGYLGVSATLFLWQSWAFSFPTPSFLLMLVLGGIVAVLYLTASWATTGRSYGKHLLGLRVVGPFGRLRVAGAFLRAVLCVLVPIGVLWVAVSRENRSLQDVVLRTSVVYDWLGGDEPPSPAQRSGR